jgi:hypothetical protein
MIHELREYAVRPGKLTEAVQLSGEVGRKIRGDDYGKLEGYWTTEIGPLNRLVSLWSFESVAERVRLRGALAEHQRWRKEFIERLHPLLVSQESRLLAPVLPFKPPAEKGQVYELRRYRAHAGKALEWVGHFKAIMPVREKYSPNVCCWQSDVGPLGEINHLWAYRDLNHRAEVRGRAAADPEWKQFLATAMPLLAEMESIVLLPTAWSPMP